MDDLTQDTLDTKKVPAEDADLCCTSQLPDETGKLPCPIAEASSVIRGRWRSPLSRARRRGSLKRMVSRPVCTDCKHCMQPKKLLHRWLWPDEPTSWCCAGMRLAGNTEWNPGVGLPCWKMRTEGACGVDAILFERTANEKLRNPPSK